MHVHHAGIVIDVVPFVSSMYHQLLGVTAKKSLEVAVKCIGVGGAEQEYSLSKAKVKHTLKALEG